MLGTVSYRDKRFDYLIIRDIIGEFSLLLVMGNYQIPNGSILEGNLHKVGCVNLLCKENQEVIPVLILASHCSEKEVFAKLRKHKRTCMLR